MEEWKDIDGYDGGYKISNLSRIKSFKQGKEKILKPSKDKYGYWVIGLTKNCKTKQFKVHRLVAKAFIPNPKNKPCINHKDGNVSNASISNLEWCSYSENLKHSYDTLKRKKYWKDKFGSKHNLSKKVIQMDKQRNIINTYESTCEAERITNINSKNIASCCRGLRKTAGGFIWRYIDEKQII